MLGVSKILCGTANVGDVLRYGKQSKNLPPHLLHYAREKKPIVVWSITRRCNLTCQHCYSDSDNQLYDGELNTEQALTVIDDLTAFKVPTILFSGGEPLMRQDLFQLAERVVANKVRCVLSTNGTLINQEIAEKIKKTGFSYVGVSIDGIEEYHDKFRGQQGAFTKALRGLRYCREQGVRVGLRFTLHKHNYKYLSDIFDLLESEEIPRLCIYHLAYSGRGSSLVNDDVTLEQTKKALDLIFERALDFHRRGLEKDILTVDNHTDNVYVLEKIKEIAPERLEDVKQMLSWNGGNQSGIAISCIDNTGNVHPDQFWMHYSLGNVKKKKFSEIWSNTEEPLLRGLRDRKKLLKGRCANCTQLDICNGNLRVRAEAVTGDVWQEDPACYLTDEELQNI